VGPELLDGAGGFSSCPQSASPSAQAASLARSATACRCAWTACKCCWTIRPPSERACGGARAVRGALTAGGRGASQVVFRQPRRFHDAPLRPNGEGLVAVDRDDDEDRWACGYWADEDRWACGCRLDSGLDQDVVRTSDAQQHPSAILEDAAHFLAGDGLHRWYFRDAGASRFVARPAPTNLTR
jgi:hypothetical protein